jgi:ubiquinone/menaquinone biosynthesis C-methylase UbiE
MSELKYRFLDITKCNMCGSTPANHLILGKRMNKSQGKNPRSKTGITTTIMKCKNCSLIFANPQPIPFDIQDHYGVPPESYWKEEYFIFNDTYFANELKTLQRLSPMKKGSKALDIGAGIGKGMIALNNAGFDTFGMEPSEPFFHNALSRMEINPERLKLGMIEEIDYPENEFDFITFGAVLEHLYSPGESIEKALKWLKPNGIIHIEIPSSHWLINKIINFYYKLNMTDYVGNISPMHSPYHLYEFGLKSFLIHGKQNKYEVIFHEYHVCNTYMPKIMDFIVKPYMRMTNTGMQLCVWLRKLE